MEANTFLCPLEQYISSHRISRMDLYNNLSHTGLAGNQKVLIQISRLSQLKDSSLEKMENRKYIRWNFIIPMIIMAVAWLAVTSAFMFMNEWNRLVLLKGILGWGLILTIYHVYPKCKSLYVNYKKYKSGRNKVHNNNSSLLSTNKTIYSQWTTIYKWFRIRFL